jgi:hypothetical protein
MESLDIIHLLNEHCQIGLCIGKGLILFEVDFLLLERLKGCTKRPEEPLEEGQARWGNMVK